MGKGRLTALLAMLLQGALWAGAVGSPAGSFRFKHLGVDEGLTNLAVMAMTQDARGYLWAGTEDGLFRYDGLRFHRYGTAEGLPSTAVRALRASTDGYVWVDTEQGLARGRNGRFTPVQAGYQGTPDTLRQVLAADATGGIWAGGQKGLWYTRGEEPFQPVAGYLGGGAEAIWVDPDGRRILVARKGTLDLRDAAGAWTRIKLPAAFAKDHPHALLLDAKGRIWVRSLNWLLRYPSPTGTPENLSRELHSGSGQWADLFQDGQERVWAPTNRGLVCFEPGGSWLLGEDRGLVSPTVNTALIDREGTLWVGSEGLQRMAGRQAWSATGRRQGLPHDSVWSLRRTRGGTLLAGTQQGLAVARGDRWVPVAGSAGRIIYAITEDAQGRALAGGTRPRGATLCTVFYQQGDRFQEIPLEGIENSVASMAWAPDGSLWVGSVSQGLHRFRLEGGRFRGVRVELPGGAENENIHHVILDAEGHPVVSGARGLATFDGRQWTRLGKAQGLRDNHPGTLALGPDGSVFMTYWEVHGIARLRPSPQGWAVVEHLDQPPELAADTVYSLGVDSKGVLWLGTTLGIRRWDGTRLEQFTHHNGLPGDDTSGNALWVEPNGDVWCGMTAGAVHFEAARYPGPAPVPQARLESFRDRAGQPLPAGAEVPYDRRTVSFAFSADTYVQEAGLRPQVRLVGFEDDWRDSEAYQGRYTGLPAGRYRFEARLRTREGVVGPPAGQDFRILPPWWQRWWALLLGVSTLAGLAAVVVRWRTGRMLRRMVDLEALVHARTWDLEQVNDALSQANAALEEASMVDPLTGLKNRRFLGLSLPEEVARVMRGIHSGGVNPHQLEMAFLLVDLDHFKAVNDTYGHAAGDDVLRQAGVILRSACRESDSVVRWGGEEFLVVAKATSREHIEAIARKILEGFRNHPFRLEDGRTLETTCSLGYSAFPVLWEAPEAFRWEDAVKLADQCLYAAKKSGRNGYVGVWAAPETRADLVQERMLTDLPGLVAAQLLTLCHSFRKDRPISWS